MSMRISILGGASIDFSRLEPCTMKEPEIKTVKVGQKVRFDPLKHIGGYGAENVRGHYVMGTVVEVHEQHQWFSVEYDCFGVKQRASFKFIQIGKDVFIRGN